MELGDDTDRDESGLGHGASLAEASAKSKNSPMLDPSSQVHAELHQ